jgi:hypothetical protein
VPAVVARFERGVHGGATSRGRSSSSVLAFRGCPCLQPPHASSVFSSPLTLHDSVRSQATPMLFASRLQLRLPCPVPPVAQWIEQRFSSTAARGWSSSGQAAVANGGDGWRRPPAGSPHRCGCWRRMEPGDRGFRRNRTQEVAGSSPASSISETPAEARRSSSVARALPDHWHADLRLHKRALRVLP